VEKKGGKNKREGEREKEYHFECLCRERSKVGNPKTDLINKL